MRGWQMLLMAGLLLAAGCNTGTATGDKGELTLKFWNEIQAVMKEQSDVAQERLKNMGSGAQSPAEAMRQMSEQHQQTMTRLSQLSPAGVDEELVSRRDQLVQAMQPAQEAIVKMASLMEQRNMAEAQGQQEINRQAMLRQAEAAKHLRELQPTLAQKYNKEFPLPEVKSQGLATPATPETPTNPETPAAPTMP